MRSGFHAPLDLILTLHLREEEQGLPGRGAQQVKSAQHILYGSHESIDWLEVEALLQIDNNVSQRRFSQNFLVEACLWVTTSN